MKEVTTSGKISKETQIFSNITQHVSQKQWRSNQTSGLTSLFKRAYLRPWPPWAMVTMGRPPSLVSPWRHWDELRQGCASYAFGRQRQSTRMPWVKVSTASSTWREKVTFWGLFHGYFMFFFVFLCFLLGYCWVIALLDYCIVGLLGYFMFLFVTFDEQLQLNTTTHIL